MSEDGETEALEALLARPVSEGRSEQRFGEMTVAQVEARAGELAAAADVPAMASRMSPVASAWRGLAEEMRRQGAATVADLGREALAGRGDRLWLGPPGGSLL